MEDDLEKEIKHTRKWEGKRLPWDTKQLIFSSFKNHGGGNLEKSIPVYFLLLLNGRQWLTSCILASVYSWAHPPAGRYYLLSPRSYDTSSQIPPPKDADDVWLDSVQVFPKPWFPAHLGLLIPCEPSLIFHQLNFKHWVSHLSLSPVVW